jgi:outer membrane lipoprotein-sorting protein
LDLRELGKFLKDEFQVSGFRFGKWTKVGEREGQAVVYKVSFDKDERPATVWIDPKTYLPVRFRFGSEGGHGRITEVYTDFQVNAPVDASKFRLPK